MIYVPWVIIGMNMVQSLGERQLQSSVCTIIFQALQKTCIISDQASCYYTKELVKVPSMKDERNGGVLSVKVEGEAIAEYIIPGTKENCHFI